MLIAARLLRHGCCAGMLIAFRGWHGYCSSHYANRGEGTGTPLSRDPFASGERGLNLERNANSGQSFEGPKPSVLDVDGRVG